MGQMLNKNKEAYIIQQEKQQKQSMFDWIKKATNRNITGNYKFHIKSEPQNPDTSATLCVTAYTDRSELAVLPCHYKWYRIRNGLTQQSYKFRGNSYVCDSSDIGAVIQAEVTSNDPQYSGSAYVQFGPIKLATQIKKHIMDTLANGSTFIRGNICLNEYLEKDCQFKIFEDMIKICHTQSELNYTFNYSIHDPRIDILPRDQNKLSLTMSQNYEGSPHLFLRSLFGSQYDKYANTSNLQCKMQVKFANKQIRDTFLLTLKAFYTKKQLKNSIIIHKVEQASFNQNESLSLLFEIESLRSDISRLYDSNEQKEKQRLKLSQQVARLQRQIEEIVTTYTRMAEEKFRNLPNLNQSYAALTSKRDQVFGRKCQNLQRQNLNLNERIKLLTAQIDEIRFNSSMAKKNQSLVRPNFTHITTIINQPPSKHQYTNFENVLQQLSESRVSEFKEDFFISKKLQRVYEQKAQLEKKLEKSFRTIDELQKKLKAQGAAHNATAVNFSMLSKIQIPHQINTSSYSLALDLERLQKQNHRLAGINENLKKQNKSLQSQLAKTASKIVVKPTQGLNENVKTPTSKQNQLQTEIQSLKKENSSLQQLLKNQTSKSERLAKDKITLQRKVDQLGNELSMYRKNQQVLNRSQHLSMEMDSYNQQQIRAFKQHNELLLSQNEKLSKAVQKYMGEARENIKLRKQILQLREKQSQKMLNPEKSQIKSVFYKYADINNSQFSLKEALEKKV